MAYLRPTGAAVDDDEVDSAGKPDWKVGGACAAWRAKRTERAVEAAHFGPVDALLRRAEEAGP